MPLHLGGSICQSLAVLCCFLWHIWQSHASARLENYTNVRLERCNWRWQRADWETFKWLFSSVQHGGRVAEATERNTLKWLLLLTGGWQVFMCEPMHTLSVYMLCVCVSLYSLCVCLCALCVSLPPCFYQDVWMCVWCGWRACVWALRSSLLRASTKQRGFTSDRLEHCHHDSI